MAGCLLAGASAQGQKRTHTGPPSLRRAIALYNAGDDARAGRELTALLAANPSVAEAAKAHLYLGLVRLNALDSARARAEFATALTIDPALELPYEAPPKAEVLFAQARASLKVVPPPAVAPTPAPVPPPAPPAEVLVMAPEPVGERPGPSHVLSLGVGAVGLAGALAGGVCLVLSATTLSSAEGANTFAESDESKARTSANEQYAAEWLLSIGGGLVGAGIVVFFVERALGASPQQATAQATSVATGKLQF